MNWQETLIQEIGGIERPILIHSACKLTIYQVAKVIETFVSNPDIQLSALAREFNTSPHVISRAISKHYLGTVSGEKEIITLQSKINFKELKTA